MEIEAEQPTSAVEQPDKLLRIAAMVRRLLDEVRTTELDEAARQRLADVHNRAVGALTELVSDDLQEELSQIAMDPVVGNETPSGPELRVVQAQLAGWLEGLFHGIQASMAAQMASRQQQAPPGQRALEGGGPGQYL